MKKRLLMSAVASTLLTGVLVFSGCGGSNSNPSAGADNINKVKIAEGSSGNIAQDQVSNFVTVPVSGKDSFGNTVQTSNIKVSKAQLADCTATDPCKIDCVQKCPTELSQSELDDATALSSSVPDSDDKLVLYAGDMKITEANGKLTDCGFEVTVQLPKCAFAKAPFSVDGKLQTFKDDEGHYVTAVEKCDIIKIYANGEWITGYIKEDPGCQDNKYVTFKVQGLPTEIEVFLLRQYVDGKTSGATGGATGSEGY